MEGFDLLSDPELDQLLQGHVPEGRPDLRPVADLAATLRWSAAAEPAPVMAYEVRRAIAQRAAPPAPARARRQWLGAVAASLAVLSFGAVGAAGALPGPLQDAMSEASGVVGLELPRAADSAEGAPGVQVAAARSGGPEAEGTEPGAAPSPDVTPSGASPAEPGPTGDQEPAVPGVPPDDAPADDDLDEPTESGDRVRGAGNAVDAEVPDAAEQEPEPADPTDGEPTDSSEPSDDRRRRPVHPPLS